MDPLSDDSFYLNFPEFDLQHFARPWPHVHRLHSRPFEISRGLDLDRSCATIVETELQAIFAQPFASGHLALPLTQATSASL